MGRARVAPWVTAAVDGMTDAAFGIGTRDQARRELRALKRAVAVMKAAVFFLEPAAHQLRGMGQCKHCRDFDTNPQARAIEYVVNAMQARLDALSGTKGRGAR